MDSTAPNADVVVGTHPVHGICATNPRQHHVAAHYLDLAGFEAVPGHPFLLRLRAPDDQAADRARFLVVTMRRAGFTVDADLGFLPAPEPQPGARPDVAIAQIPLVGIAAATEAPPGQPDPDAQTLADLGWHPHPDHHVHVLPDMDRDTTLATVTRTVLALQKQGRHVAVEPALTAQTLTWPTAATPGRAPATSLRASALATSPARSSLPATPAAPTPLPEPAPPARASRTPTAGAER